MSSYYHNPEIVDALQQAHHNPEIVDALQQAHHNPEIVDALQQALRHHKHAYLMAPLKGTSIN